jgi:hypothetical protein
MVSGAEMVSGTIFVEKAIVFGYGESEACGWWREMAPDTISPPTISPPISEDAKRQCALGNPAACGIF